ncbi:MAG: hypothetical protein R2880_03090 [Deinococcales bacterium]
MGTAQLNDALAIVREGQGRFPQNAELLLAEAVIYEKNGQQVEALGRSDVPAA